LALGSRHFTHTSRGLATKLVQQVKCNTIFNISLGMLLTDVAYKIFGEVSGKTLYDIFDVHSTTIFTFDPSFVAIYLGLHSHLLSLWNFNFFQQLSRTTIWSNLCWIFHL
jgi:hypothetical protein